MLLVLYKENGELIDIIPNAEVRNGSIFVGSSKIADGINCQWTYIPDQEFRHLYQVTEDGQRVLKGSIADLRMFSPEELQALIDRDTAQKINASMHPFTPIEEQIGILREQIVVILNALGIEPTPQFARLNEVAIQAIEEARKLKGGPDA